MQDEGVVSSASSHSIKSATVSEDQTIKSIWAEERTDNVFLNCCLLMCCVCGCLNCPEKGKRINRKMLFVTVSFWMAVLFFILFLIVRFGFFNSLVHPVELSRGDMKLIDKQVSSALCSAMTIKSDGDIPFDAYLLESSAHIDYGRYDLRNYSVTAFMAENDVRYYKFYFLVGTIVDVTICSSSAANYYLILGKNVFEQFTKPGKKKCKNSHCYSESRAIASRGVSYCGNSYGLEVNYDADYSADYYHVVRGSPSVRFFFQLKKSQYDVGEATKIVNHEVRQEYPSMTDQSSTVVFLPYNSIYPDATLKMKCHSRPLGYLIYFVALPAGLLLLLLPVICFARRNRNVEPVDI